MSEEEFFEAADRKNAIKMIFTVTDRRDHIQLDIRYSAINFVGPIVYEFFFSVRAEDTSPPALLLDPGHSGQPTAFPPNGTNS